MVFVNIFFSIQEIRLESFLNKFIIIFIIYSTHKVLSSYTIIYSFFESPSIRRSRFSKMKFRIEILTIWQLLLDWGIIHSKRVWIPICPHRGMNIDESKSKWRDPLRIALNSVWVMAYLTLNLTLCFTYL